MTHARRWRFAWRALARDRQAGELRVLALTLIVAVASVTAVGFFTDRIGRAVEQQASDRLAADLRVTSGLPLPKSLIEEVAERPLDTARHTSFPSVVINAEDESQLVAVKAVTRSYPLRGNLKLAPLDAPNAVSTHRRQAPAPGTVWVDAQLMSALQLAPGDRLTLGKVDFEVTRLILLEPDRDQTLLEFAPRVMMNDDDLDRAGLLDVGSRAQFALLMAGARTDLTDMRAWIRKHLDSELWVQDARSGSPRMRRALNRAQRFLGLATVVTVLLAGAAIALAIRHFAYRQADASAVLRTLGASRLDVFIWLGLRLGLIALIASLIGSAIGYVVQLILAALLQDWFGFALPAPGLLSPVIGVITALFALSGFGFLPVLQASRVDVMQVLQRNHASFDRYTSIAVGLGLAASLAIVFLLSRDLSLSTIVVAGVAVMLSVLGLFGRMMIRVVRTLAGARYRLAVSGLERRASSSVMQLMAFGVGIMALLLIAIVRVDLLAAWEQDLPESLPNVFVVNIQSDQVQGFANRLASQGIESAGIHPLVRARLVAHNGEPIVNENSKMAERRRARFEYNLSFAEQLPAANTIVAGKWWNGDANSRSLLSLEREWANQRGFAIGDTLTFRAAGIDTTAEISNLRDVDWESFQPNFVAVGTPVMLEGFPATYITSLHTDRLFTAVTSGWAREFPGIATIDIGAVMLRVKSLMDRASLAVEYVFLFTVFAGFCVLLAAVQSSQRERIRESALLRALGASDEQVRRAVIAEFATLGGIAGFLGALFATMIGYALSRFVFELPFQPNMTLWLLGVVGGAVGIGTVGYLATRRVLSTPPIEALRESA